MTEFLQLLFQGVVARLDVRARRARVRRRLPRRAASSTSRRARCCCSAPTRSPGWRSTSALAFGLAVLAATVLLALAGAAMHGLVLRRVVGQPTFVLVMITIGIGIAVTHGVEAVFGPDQRLLGDPWGSSSFAVGGVTINDVKVWGIAVTLAALGRLLRVRPLHALGPRDAGDGRRRGGDAVGRRARSAACTPARGRWPARWRRSAGCSSPASPARRSRRSATRRCARSRRSCSAGSRSPVGAVVGGAADRRRRGADVGLRARLAGHELLRGRALHRDDRDPARRPYGLFGARAGGACVMRAPGLLSRSSRRRARCCRSSSGRRR